MRGVLLACMHVVFGLIDKSEVLLPQVQSRISGHLL